MPYYFAYGSNMNPARVEARIGDTRRAVAGVLVDHVLRFDKASKVPGISHANVAPRPGERVEGVLFELASPEQIRDMDPSRVIPMNIVDTACPSRRPKVPSRPGYTSPGRGPPPMRCGLRASISSTCCAVRPFSRPTIMPGWPTYRQSPDWMTGPWPPWGCHATVRAEASPSPGTIPSPDITRPSMWRASLTTTPGHGPGVVVVALETLRSGRSGHHRR
ncbi:hypothetical protein A8U91_01825 [Halomonas elongata]|uniref:AIG2-like family protein n=1 Tax=Halomonas elongata TaxID=2746 RepID=A0A1B8P5E4_HALEL|nr:hypothetical protein A8U91_01825 [Halomonas elongata]